MVEKVEVVIEPGTLGEDEAETVCRNLRVLYGTRAGELALDREFGLDADLMDYPQESARALLAAEIVRKTARYEPRASVERVDWLETEQEKGKMIPKVVVSIV